MTENAYFDKTLEKKCPIFMKVSTFVAMFWDARMLGFLLFE